MAGCQEDTITGIDSLVGKDDTTSFVNVYCYNGGTCYNFEGDSFTEFSYFDIGEENGYVRIEDEWYEIKSPSDIPFEIR